MSRFMQWFVADQLKGMGWPKPKGMLKKLYVNTSVLDVAVENSIHVLVGLGAGRPQLGIAVLADTFANNPWTRESTIKLLRDLKEDGDHEIENNPELPPWKALYAKYRMVQYGNDILWKQLGDAVLQSAWAMSSAQGIFWGLTHERDMPDFFAKDKADYERTTAEAIPYGLAVSEKYPWTSLEHFYEACEDLIRGFESARPPLREVPTALRAAPEIVHRLGTVP